MFERDYIMRLIHEMVHSILKLLFKIEDEKIEDVQIKDSQVEEKYNHFIELVDQGEINKAENQLYEKIDRSNKEYLKASLMFYEYLNKLDIETLEKNNYSKKEIRNGITHILEEFGYKGITDIFMN